MGLNFTFLCLNKGKGVINGISLTNLIKILFIEGCLRGLLVGKKTKKKVHLSDEK